MNEFILTAIGVAVIVGVCGMLTPDGETKKYLRFAGALCLICALVSPLIGAISSGDIGYDGIFPPVDSDEDIYDEIYKNSLAEGAKDNAETLLYENLLKQFKLPADSLAVSISLSYDGEEYSVGSVQVILKSTAVYADPREISEYINAELGCPCFVVYE